MGGNPAESARNYFVTSLQPEKYIADFEEFATRLEEEENRSSPCFIICMDSKFPLQKIMRSSAKAK